ncbi:MAG: hypothetical protein ACTSU9_04600 [Promethearchaeota archaeon]
MQFEGNDRNEEDDVDLILFTNNTFKKYYKERHVTCWNDMGMEYGKFDGTIRISDERIIRSAGNTGNHKHNRRNEHGS